MTSKTPSYLTKNRLGIYLFQIRVPIKLRLNKSLFRKSLQTRDRSEALKKSMRLKCMFDDLVNRYFDSTEEFAAGMKLLALYETKADHTEWNKVESFLMQLEPDEDALLERAISYKKFKIDSRPTSSITEAFAELSDKIEIIAEHYSKPESKPLSSLVDEFIKERQSKWDTKNIKKNTKSLKPKLDLFVEVVGDIDSAQLQIKHSVLFKNALLSMPKNRRKGIYKELTINEITSLDIPKHERMANETLKSYFGRISTFLTWLARNNYSVSNLSEPFIDVTAKSKADYEQRPPFNDDELTRLFNSKQYIQGSHKQASHYWVPLLALFTGARQNELCQLYKCDIYQEQKTGIWVIDINEKADDKSLKKSHHARLVPIHKQLILLGFLD